MDSVPRFDASIEIFAEHKTVKVVYDTPYIKGLPTTMHVRTTAGDGAFHDSIIRRTYEDPYTLEMKELYAIVTEGKEIKTTPADARKDLEIFGMFLRAGMAGQQSAQTNGFVAEDGVNGGTIPHAKTRPSVH